MPTNFNVMAPHRGGKTKMTTGAGASTVLADGELFVEYPDTGAGTGKSKIKIGDGVTAYSSLPYALGETSTDLITFSESTATSVTQALNEAVSGASLATIIGGLKKAIQLASQSGGVSIFTGTLAEWNQLTDEEKAQYDLISNDEPGGLQDMFPSSLVGYGANSNVEAELNKLNDEMDAIYHTISGTTISSLTSTIFNKLTLEQKCRCSIYIIDSEGDTFNLHIGQFSGNSGSHHIPAYFNWMRLANSGVVERRLDMTSEKFYKIIWNGSVTQTEIDISSWTIYYTGPAIS